MNLEHLKQLYAESKRDTRKFSEFQQRLVSAFPEIVKELDDLERIRRGHDITCLHCEGRLYVRDFAGVPQVMDNWLLPNQHRRDQVEVSFDSLEREARAGRALAEAVEDISTDCCGSTDTQNDLDHALTTYRKSIKGV